MNWFVVATAVLFFLGSCQEIWEGNYRQGAIFLCFSIANLLMSSK